MKRKPRRWKRWAVVSKTGLCYRSPKLAAAIYFKKESAEEDCAGDYQWAQEVEVKEIVRKP